MNDDFDSRLARALGILCLFIFLVLAASMIYGAAW